ncbi:MAG: glycosyltransferase family 4 protein [Vulcanimicrobiaceae bacterium]
MFVVGSLQGGGAERCVRELSPRLRARGVEVEIVTVYPPGLAPSELTELGIPVHWRPKRPGFDAVHFLWLARTMARRRPTIVHTHMQAGKYVGRFAAILARVPIIIHTEHSPNPLTRLERFLIPLFARWTTAVVTFGQENVRIVRAREPVRRFEIIRNGIAIESMPTLAQRRDVRRELGIEESDVVFAIVASLQERKNHRLAFDALASMKDDAGPRVRLALFGDGALRAELEHLARERGIDDRVHFYGFRGDVRRLLAGIDVLLSVAVLEMAPISMLEAMGNGIPIVATPHPGTSDMVVHDETGLIVGWDVATIASAMRRLRDAPLVRVRLGRAGRERVARNHDVETIADRHLDLYRTLANVPPRVVRR